MGGANDRTNSYEEIRKLRVQENQKRFEDLGILNLSKGLSDLNHSQKKSSEQRLPNTKPKPENALLEPRRSTRARNPVQYCDNLDIGLPLERKRSRSSSSLCLSYIARPLDEIKIASYEQRVRAMKAAEEFKSTIPPANPSFVKSMVRSHVYSCFWLGLPSQFCKKYLTQKDLDVTLVDENGLEYDAKYLGKRAGLSGGWRGFALEHKLDDGDALVFELVEPHKFKVWPLAAYTEDNTQLLGNLDGFISVLSTFWDVHTFRVSSQLSGGKLDGNVINMKGSDVKDESKEDMKVDLHQSQKPRLKRYKSMEDESNALPDTQNQKLGADTCRKHEVSNTQKPQSPSREDGTVQLAKDQNNGKRVVSKCRKKPAPRLLFKRV